jgi:integrase
MKNKSIQLSNPSDLATQKVIERGKALNKYVSSHAFENALLGKALNTERRKRADLRLLEDFLFTLGMQVQAMYSNPEAWRGITWGTVEAFKLWMISEGYSIASINARLSTVRCHASIAAKSGVIRDTEARMIAGVKGFRSSDGRHIDEKRSLAGRNTRRVSRARMVCRDGSPVTTRKKANATDITEDEKARLLDQPDTPQGRRDKLLLCLLFEHNLRIGEAAILTRKSFDLKKNVLTFDRPKVGLKDEKHFLSPNTRAAAMAYLEHDAPASGTIWRRSYNSDHPLGKSISAKSATKSLARRVELLGRKIGIPNLSPHDGRHWWATNEARHETTPDKMMAGGGWKTPNMAIRYIAREGIANTGTVYGQKKDKAG